MSRLDHLRQTLAVTCKPRGRRAELAAWLANESPGTAAESWRVKIHRFLAGTDGVNAETALALQDWIQSQKPPPPPHHGSADGLS